MAIPEPFDPDLPTACPQCGWAGAAGDAVVRPDDVVLCPVCSEAVVRTLPDDTDARRPEGT